MRSPRARNGGYRGESPPKKLTRILFYSAVKNLLGSKFSTSNFLVIPSQYAGDLATLTALGVCEHHIYCVDIDKHAIETARFKYPNANYANCPFWEAFDYFPKLKHTLGCAFIDLCSPLRPEVFRRVLDLGHYTKWLGFEFMYGREKGDLLKALGLGGTDDKLTPRLQFVQRAQSKGKYFHAKEHWAYTSHSESHFGKPMFVSLGSLSYQSSALHQFSKVKCTEAEMRKTCIRNPKFWRLWNIAESTTIAWRAHESRGTYK
jgi:hypothetical protein